MSNDPERLREQQPPAKARRSRAGCNECRRLHRKCDEGKPECRFCRDAGKDCVYGQRISWGGRPFGKSSFGSYLTSGAVQKQTNRSETKPSLQHSFVYGSVSAPVSTAGASRDVSESPGAPRAQEILKELTTLDWLPQRSRLLVDHFVNGMGAALSLTKDSHDEMCSVILPMALEARSYLLAAVLCLSGTHRINLGLEENRAENVAWRHQCMAEMQHAIVQSNQRAENVFIAAALLICYTDILEGGEKPISWSLHLRGALAKLSQSELAIGEPITAARRHLNLRCQSLQVLTHFSSWDLDLQPLHASEARASAANATLGAINHFHGFATYLEPLLVDMHLATAEKAALKDLDCQFFTSANSLETLWQSLNLRVGRMLAQVNMMAAWASERSANRAEPSQPGVWNAGFDVGLTARDQWAHINEAYHCACMLYILRELQGLSAEQSEVRQSVNKGLWCMRQIEIRNEACPGAALLQPLFTIGCETVLPDDRAFVILTLDRLRKLYGKVNAERAAEFLQALWIRRDSQDFPEQTSVADLMGKFRAHSLPFIAPMLERQRA